eukprot:gene147-95_t
MQELTSIHHTPSCFTNGQYDPSVHRVYIVLDDASNRVKDPMTVLRSLQNYFPSAATKILTINSLPPSSPNLHQPDMWTRYLIPKFFPQHAPSVDITKALPLSPMNNLPVIGCRLSGDDFMKLQDFCVWLFTEQITPHLERRINMLHTQVNESKKGMKNVLKSFWRKPRDENDFARGGIKYRYDKIETQIMLLADISFIIKDYETALSMYRLVRDDYKADKANLHYAQVVFMIALCQLLTEPQKYKEIFGQIEMVGQCITAGLEVPHAALFYSIMCSEMFTYHQHYRSPLDAAKFLLIAASSLSARYPLQCSLLMERVASFYLQGNQVRKFVFYEVLAGHKYLKCGVNAAKHASICYAASLMILEKSGWADIKVKLAKALTRDLKQDPREGVRRSLIFMLKVLLTALQDSSDSAALMEAVSVLSEIQSMQNLGHIRVLDVWTSILTREALLGSLPIEVLAESRGGKSAVEICNFPVPSVDPAMVKLVEPINGLYTLSSSGHFTSSDRQQRELLLRLYKTSHTHAVASSTLMTEIINLLPLTSANVRNMSDLRMSSVGQIEMDVGSAFAEVDENMSKVISVMTMGAAKPSVRKVTKHGVSRPDVGIHVSPNERHARCFPITATPAHSQCSWVIPLPDESIDIFKRSSLMPLDEIIERFVAIWYSMEHFSRDLEITLQEVALAESRRGTLGVAVLWVCRWQGKLRWGLHHAHHVRRSVATFLESNSTAPSSLTPSASSQKLLTASSSSSSSSSSSGKRSVAGDSPATTAYDWVVVGLRHASDVSLAISATNSAHRYGTVTVTVDLRSVHHHPVYVTLQIIDDQQQASQEHSNHSYAWSPTACLWEGKVRYEEIVLAPQETQSRQFTLLCLQSGVFDVNRFEMKVSSTPGEESSGVFQRVVGQSLLTVS